MSTFGDRYAFAKLLRAVGAVPGLERVRFTSPHPRDFTADVIEAMAETPTVMPQLHMPLQSGSDAVLRAMRRSYRQDRYLGIIDDVRAAMPDAAITTDIIVGFPGETEDDFEPTLDVVRSRGSPARSPSSTPSAPVHRPPTCPTSNRRPLCRSATSASSTSSKRSPGPRTRRLVGAEVEVLVAEGEGRKDAATGRISGRARDNRLVHFTLPGGADIPRPGDMVTTAVTYAAPHHLVADSGVVTVRGTRAGDAWQRAQPADDGSSASGSPGAGTFLGLPGRGAPVAS